VWCHQFHDGAPSDLKLLVEKEHAKAKRVAFRGAFEGVLQARGGLSEELKAVGGADALHMASTSSVE